MHQSVESDIHGLHKVTDNTSVVRLQLETEIKALKEELLSANTMKNQAEPDKHRSQQTEESTTVVTTQSTEVGAAEMTLAELRCPVQSLEIGPDSVRNPKASLENSLKEVEARYTLQMEQLNGILLHLESLEPEITTYRRLPEEGEDFNLGDALDSSNSLQTVQRTTTRRAVGGKVVPETSDTKVLRHEASRSRVFGGEQEANKKFRGHWMSKKSLNTNKLIKLKIKRYEMGIHTGNARRVQRTRRTPEGCAWRWSLLPEPCKIPLAVIMLCPPHSPLPGHPAFSAVNSGH
ncbi:hypothetical protein P7K49_005610 [Saguinus oedipus]|uniref:IF rod domain-containing protein n=1 Tax=Saguinus oedipus TaxID=9490 RepID=A0ABQ9W0M9_SAGOE|nr:hypothetical protein P7K49_005610 [Saguinus oedipus]